jgi:hypothetical protein
MITLHDVYDIRTGKFHSVVRIKPHNTKWFVTVDEWEGGDAE